MTLKAFAIFPLSILIIHTPLSFAQIVQDTTLPSIRITKPVIHATLVSSKIIVEGTAFDNESGIQKVEAFIHTIPFDNRFPYKLATPAAPGDWSSWSIELDISEAGTYRILARATDNAGRSNWYVSTIQIPFVAEKFLPQKPDYKHRIALVEPTFTSAAYGPGGFYEFYPKYAAIPTHEVVMEDLDLLTGDLPEVYDQSVDEYYDTLIEGIKRSFVEAQVVVIRDEDVHDGNIFAFGGENAYDVLILLHDEYVSQEMYDNYRNFVSNGGTLILVDSNTFYAEVSYDRVNRTITLVKGHDWEFNGREARKSVSERYAEENIDFIGSNYVINQISDNITFDDNPFDYVHFEENQLLNSNAIILHDYNVTFPPNYPNLHHLDATIATYELKYGGGKVITLGIYGTRVVENDKFQEFWSDVILLHALFSSYEVEVDSHEFSIYLNDNIDRILNMRLDGETKTLVIELNSTDTKEDILLISLPRQLIDIDESIDARLGVVVDGNPVSHSEFLLSHIRVLRIPLENNASQIEIQGTKVIPEFSMLPLATVASFLLVFFVLRIMYGKSQNGRATWM
jgi:hypothetical protein